MINELREWVLSIKGTYMTYSVFAVDGGHFDFDESSARRKNRHKETPRYTVYARCPIKLTNREGIISGNTLSDTASLRSRYADDLSGRRVERADIDTTDNSLRVLFECGTLLSVFPTNENSDSGAWVLYSEPLLKGKYVVVWREKTELHEGRERM